MRHCRLAKKRFVSIIETRNTLTIPLILLNVEIFERRYLAKCHFIRQIRANEYDEDEFVLECAREDGYA